MSALEIQVGGAHYKSYAIQPVEFCHANGLGGIESSIIRYACRWREKNGLEDIAKIPHYVDLLVEIEDKYDLRAEFPMRQGSHLRRNVVIPAHTFVEANKLGPTEGRIIRLAATWRFIEGYTRLLEIKPLAQELAAMASRASTNHA